ncbi:MAG: hypothetical protein K2J20_06890 [Bacilli bacterium]|nr:hypothetical protein [Bacilli bacterium]
MEDKLFKLNLKEIPDHRYTFEAYSNSPFDSEVLNKAEEKISGSNLLVSSPLTPASLHTD